jgi:hypothetical protein
MECSPDDNDPIYSDWLRKAAWSITEALYLVAGMDPSLNPQNIEFDVDLDTGTTTPIAVSPARVARAARAAIEMQRRGVPDLIDRAIKAGDLPSNGDYVRPYELLAYLRKHHISLPAGLCSALTEPLLAKAMEGWFATPKDMLPADVRARLDLDLPGEDWDALNEAGRIAAVGRPLTRNQRLQAAAEAVADKWKRDKQSPFTKRDIAGELKRAAEWKHLDRNTIERNTRATWTEARPSKERDNGIA